MRIKSNKEILDSSSDLKTCHNSASFKSHLELVESQDGWFYCTIAFCMKHRKLNLITVENHKSSFRGMKRVINFNLFYLLADEG